MTWSKEYSVGHREIDNDHRQLFDVVNRLYDEVTAGFEKPHIEETLSFLASYTQYHFQREEYVMQYFKYPHAAEHIAEHDNLIKTLSNLIFEYEKGDAAITSDTLDFVKNWLMFHTGSSDLRFGEYIRSEKRCLDISRLLVSGGHEAPNPRKTQDLWKKFRPLMPKGFSFP